MGNYRTNAVFAVLAAFLFAGGTFFSFAQETAFPYEGEVTGAQRVNVRAGAGINYKILKVAEKGDRLTVLGEKVGWLEIRMPEGSHVWVHKDFVDRKDGTGTVTGDRLNVRASNTGNADVVGQLNKGDRISIVGQEGDWLKIVPTEGITAWIFGKYVQKASGPAPGEKKKPAAPETGPVPPELEEFWTLLKAEQRKPIDEQDYSRILALADEILAELEDPVRREQVETAVEMIRGVEKNLQRIDLVKREQQTEIERIEADYQRRLQSILDRTPKEPEFLTTGWLFERGRSFNPGPGTHELKKGGRTIAYLKSEAIDLNRFHAKYVGVNGVKSAHPSRVIPVILITDIREIREGK